VTSPTGAPPSVVTVMCARGMARSSPSRPQDSRAGPASFSAIRASRPQNAGFFHPTAQPQRACTGVMSSDRSWPCSG
jgi:hypothetical protein